MRQLAVECKERGVFFCKLWKQYQTEVISHVQKLFELADKRAKSLLSYIQEQHVKIETLEGENEKHINDVIDQNVTISRQD